MTYNYNIVLPTYLILFNKAWTIIILIKDGRKMIAIIANIRSFASFEFNITILFGSRYCLCGPHHGSIYLLTGRNGVVSSLHDITKDQYTFNFWKYMNYYKALSLFVLFFHTSQINWVFWHLLDLFGFHFKEEPLWHLH